MYNVNPLPYVTVFFVNLVRPEGAAIIKTGRAVSLQGVVCMWVNLSLGEGFDPGESIYCMYPHF
jgi:hypothetical protein